MNFLQKLDPVGYEKVRARFSKVDWSPAFFIIGGSGFAEAGLKIAKMLNSNYENTRQWVCVAYNMDCSKPTIFIAFEQHGLQLLVCGLMLMTALWLKKRKKTRNTPAAS